MTLNHQGIFLTLVCGTQLQFPLQTSNNLPFMLTSKSLKSRSKSTSSQHHVSILSYGTDLTKFYLSSIYTYFRASSVDLYQAVLFQPPIDPATISRNNQNLSPPQKELLLWHYCLGHLGLQHVQSLLTNQKNPVG